ncbi:hypothetical protein L3X65_26095 [Vibrio diabolicus]|uniref:hypothetical protein n=5 Tax=Vibrio harveyi group TaxID=717610 RepID=UPI00211B2ECB|nr:hypothetical protein [Vibrio diabolicus]MCG9232580.1 hypothetical protein [Vibrio diabolicus]MCG9574481.1 hypothetical protein [Vibrio diabolicus]MCG9593643.1 hypothetical protein [Vibrio diabolicus]
MLTKRLRQIRNARHFQFALNLVFTAQCFRLGGQRCSLLNAALGAHATTEVFKQKQGEKMSEMYLSMPFEKEDEYGNIKKDVDQSIKSNWANGYILNEAQLSYLNNSENLKVILIDRIRKRRVEGYYSGYKPTQELTRFGYRHDIKLSNLKEVLYKPVVFKYHRTGVKLTSSSGDDIK